MTDTTRTLECIRQRADVLCKHDAQDMAIWAHEVGDEELLASALAFARARYALAARANALLLMASDAVGE